MTRRYNIDTPEYDRMQQNQRLFLILSMGALLLLAVGAFIGLAWYFFGQTGGIVAFFVVAILSVGLVIWLMVIGSVNVASNIQRDTAHMLVDFQSADDRGEVMRHMANMMKSGNQLDKSVLSLAGNLAKGQAKALTDSHYNEQRMLEQSQENEEWWNVPDFEVIND